MPDASIPYQILSDEILETRFLIRGSFHIEDADHAPDGVKTLVMIGNAGPALFDQFPKKYRSQADGLDTWTKEVLTPIADRVGGVIYFPFDGPPYYPFVAWAHRAEPVYQSPIGLTLHPRYGLWHAYRAAIGFTEKLDIPEREADGTSPCDTCEGKPCLLACPVNALRTDDYNVNACVDHMRSEEGIDCRALGCRSRRACPVGQYYRYTMDQASFHMAAFLRHR